MTQQVDSTGDNVNTSICTSGVHALYPTVSKPSIKREWTPASGLAPPSSLPPHRCPRGEGERCTHQCRTAGGCPRRAAPRSCTWGWWLRAGCSPAGSGRWCCCPRSGPGRSPWSQTGAPRGPRSGTARNLERERGGGDMYLERVRVGRRGERGDGKGERGRSRQINWE